MFIAKWFCTRTKATSKFGEMTWFAFPPAKLFRRKKSEKLPLHFSYSIRSSTRFLNSLLLSMYFTRLWLILLHADHKFMCNIRQALLPRLGRAGARWSLGPFQPKAFYDSAVSIPVEMCNPKGNREFPFPEHSALAAHLPHARAAQWHTSTWPRRALLLPPQGFSCPSPKPRTWGCGSRAQSDSISATADRGFHQARGRTLDAEPPLPPTHSQLPPSCTEQCFSPLGEGVPEHTMFICSSLFPAAIPPAPFYVQYIPQHALLLFSFCTCTPEPEFLIAPSFSSPLAQPITHPKTQDFIGSEKSLGWEGL